MVLPYLSRTFLKRLVVSAFFLFGLLSLLAVCDRYCLLGVGNFGSMFGTTVQVTVLELFHHTFEVLWHTLLVYG